MSKRMAVIVDYENIFRTGHAIFGKESHIRNSTIDPYRFACQIARIKNVGLQPADENYVEVTRVEVYRGLPDPRANPKGNKINQTQKRNWMAGHHNVVDVKLRPLKLDRSTGEWREKGVDVLCALALVRAARNGIYDVVVLASRDTDLAPAIDEAYQLKARGVKIEAVKWYDPEIASTNGNLKTECPLWTNGLWRSEYELSLDPSRDAY